MTRSLATWQAAYDAMSRAVPALTRKGYTLHAVHLITRMKQIKRIMAEINHEIMEE